MISSKENVVTLHRPNSLGELLGLWAGGLMAPSYALGSLVRQARIFHPRGVYFKAEVDVADEIDPQFEALADGLTKGDTMVRLSTGFWSMGRLMLPDILGVSVRFNAAADAGYVAQDGSQDLLMVTSKFLLTLPIAALLTNSRDFLANDYHGMGKYSLVGKPNMYLRLRSMIQSSNSSRDRYDKIRTDVADGDVVFTLEAASRLEPSRWYPLVQIRLVSELTIDDRVTMFWPFRTGLGIRPEGFTQFLRPAPYLASQWARNAGG
ncbi:hypothetical protein ENSA5_21990 [Enhygromyxa salina]|uniref:Uncharacterized protein n=1 Tax=Enhygromyxa salina TaxID=215803 RepID=A0A2S9YBR2_9BACT|nr:hypothetical protein [Enhygromyxa salina]PRQ02554.1 hypothetical protein ENSA5_21990 [Enhygromyxa salina]